MPTSHGVIQGYNAQALVDSRHQVILAAEAFSSRDHENLAPMLSGAKKNLRDIGKKETYFEGKELTADSSYHSFNNLTLCRDEKIDAYIPDIQFRKRDPRFADQQGFQDGFQLLTFSPDSTRFAFRAQRGNKQLVVVDGKEEPGYDKVVFMCFSPDSKKLAYVAEDNNKQFVVLDGVKDPEYDGLATGTPIFSADSTRIAYAAQSGNKWFTVVDGVSDKLYDGLSLLTFSPDSSRFVYRAQIGYKQAIVENAEEGKQFDGIGDITFSPDSRHVVYKGFLGEKVYLVVDGKELEQYDRIMTTIFFDSPEFIHFLAVKHLSASEDEVMLVVKKIE